MATSLDNRQFLDGNDVGPDMTEIARDGFEQVRSTTKPPAKIGCIYFIKCATGPVKIGHARHVAIRVSNLQMGNPNQLTLIAWAPVSNPRDFEEELHDMFRPHRIRGEWFAPAPELLAYAARLDAARLKAIEALSLDA